VYFDVIRNQKFWLKFWFFRSEAC